MPTFTTQIITHYNIDSDPNFAKNVAKNKKTRNVKLQTKPQNINNIEIQTNPNNEISTDTSDLKKCLLELNKNKQTIYLDEIKFKSDKELKYAADFKSNSTDYINLLPSLRKACSIIEPMIEENNNTTTWIEQDLFLKNTNNEHIELLNSRKVLKPTGNHANCEKLLFFVQMLDSKLLIFIKTTFDPSRSKFKDRERAQGSRSNISTQKYYLCYKTTKILLSQKPTGLSKCSESKNNRNFAVSFVDGTIQIYKLNSEDDTIVSQFSDENQNRTNSGQNNSQSDYKSSHTDSITMAKPFNNKDMIMTSSLDGDLSIWNFLNNQKLSGKNDQLINLNFYGDREQLDEEVSAGITCFDIIREHGLGGDLNDRYDNDQNLVNNFGDQDFDDDYGFQSLSDLPNQVVVGYENGEIWLFLGLGIE